MIKVGQATVDLVQGDIVDLGLFARQPLLWAANPALGLLPASRLTLGIALMLEVLAAPLKPGYVALAQAVGVAIQALVSLPQMPRASLSSAFPSLKQKYTGCGLMPLKKMPS